MYIFLSTEDTDSENIISQCPMFPRISADLLSRVGGHMYPLNFERQPYFDSFLQCVEERE